MAAAELPPSASPLVALFGPAMPRQRCPFTVGTDLAVMT
jgi:hypothetical protein